MRMAMPDKRLNKNPYKYAETDGEREWWDAVVRGQPWSNRGWKARWGEAIRAPARSTWRPRGIDRGLDRG